MFILDRNDKSSPSIYQDEFDNFGSFESQEILSRMINSVKSCNKIHTHAALMGGASSFQ